MTYEMTIAGVTRQLPLRPINDETMIGAFVVFGDVEMTIAGARELLKLLPEYDYLIAPEAKAIPLIHEMARQSGRNDYFLVRKVPKFYMKGVFEVEVKSITTASVQKLYMDGEDAKKMNGKRIVIVDDVISTGESVKAVEELVNKAGGIVVARVAILAEGKAADRDDIIYLKKLPLFNSKGEPID